MINVHASGGVPMMQAAAQGRRPTPRGRLGRPQPLVIGVTVLTSMDDGDAARASASRGR